LRVFHFTAPEHGLKALRHQRLKVATIHNLNDPFELLCVDAPDKKARKALTTFKNRIAKKSGILCFRQSWSNPLMWSHYAKSHTGVALEFDVSDAALFTVKYTARRVPWDIPVILASGGFTQKHADTIFATKSLHWKYEREQRVAIRLSDCEKHDSMYFETFGRDFKLVGLVLGPLCTIANSELKDALPFGHKISVRKARLAHRSFNIVRDKTVRPYVLGSAA
jgi:hypothetical protein